MVAKTLFILSFKMAFFADVAEPPAHKIIPAILFSILGAGIVVICILAFFLIRDKIRKNANK